MEKSGLDKNEEAKATNGVDSPTRKQDTKRTRIRILEGSKKGSAHENPGVSELKDGSPEKKSRKRKGNPIKAEMVRLKKLFIEYQKLISDARRLKNVSGMRAALPTRNNKIAKDLKAGLDEIPKKFTCREKKEKDQNDPNAGIHGGLKVPILASSQLRDFLNKHYPGTVNETGLVTRSLVTSLISDYNHKHSLVEGVEGKMRILYRNDSELEALFAPGIKRYNDEAEQERRTGKKTGKNFKVAIDPDNFRNTDVQKAIKYHYTPMEKKKREAYMKEHGTDAGKESERLQKLLDEAKKATKAREKASKQKKKKDV